MGCVRSNGMQVLQEYHRTPLYIIPIYIDNNFCFNDRQLIIGAIERWNLSLNGYLVLKVWKGEFDLQDKLDEAMLYKRSYVIMKVNSRYFSIIEQDAEIGGGTFTVGLANYIGGNVIYLVKNRLDDISLPLVTMHEIGHLLGAYHEGNYLMGPKYSENGYRCIDEGTMRQVSSWWKLPFDGMRYCLNKE